MMVLPDSAAPGHPWLSSGAPEDERFLFGALAVSPARLSAAPTVAAPGRPAIERREEAGRKERGEKINPLQRASSQSLPRLRSRRTT